MDNEWIKNFVVDENNLRDSYFNFATNIAKGLPNDSDLLLIGSTLSNRLTYRKDKKSDLDLFVFHYDNILEHSLLIYDPIKVDAMFIPLNYLTNDSAKRIFSRTEFPELIKNILREGMFYNRLTEQFDIRGLNHPLLDDVFNSPFGDGIDKMAYEKIEQEKRYREKALKLSQFRSFP